MLGQLCAAVGTRQTGRQTGLSPQSCDNPLARESTGYGNSVCVKRGKLFSSARSDRCSRCCSPAVCKWAVLEKDDIRCFYEVSQSRTIQESDYDDSLFASLPGRKADKISFGFLLN